MDSRDFKENPDRSSHFLEGIYELQTSLVDNYIKIEGLPQYPINLNTKTNQNILKDFTSRVVEELAEGFEALLFVDELTNKNNYWAFDYKVDEYNAALNHLQNFGEEMADALHFYIELLIYVNVKPENFVSYLQKRKSINFIDGSLLKVLMDLGYREMIYTEYNSEIAQIKSFNLINLLKPVNGGSVSLDQDIRYFLAGSIHNSNLLNLYKTVLWDIVYHLNISRNFLKNKPWKQSQVMTAESLYQEKLVEGFINFMGFLQMVGCDEKLVYFLYFKKNLINQFRIRSKY